MPHIAVTMIPGRDSATKKELAEKLQRFLADELAIDTGVVSVSIQDIPMQDWAESMKKFPEDILFVPPAPPKK